MSSLFEQFLNDTSMRYCIFDIMCPCHVTISVLVAHNPTVHSTHQHTVQYEASLSMELTYCSRNEDMCMFLVTAAALTYLPEVNLVNSLKRWCTRSCLFMFGLFLIDSTLSSHFFTISFYCLNSPNQFVFIPNPEIN